MRKLILMLAALFVLPITMTAQAAGASSTVTITAPSTYSDGEALPLASIASYTLSWSPVAGQHGPSGSLTVTPSGVATTPVNVPVPCGSTTFEVTVTTSAAAEYPTDTSGESNTVAYASGLSCTPNPPTITVS